MTRPKTIATTLAALTLALFATFPDSAGAAGGWRWPVDGPVLTRYANGADPYAGGQHRGIDIGAPAGARVVAAAGGTVTFAGSAGSSGLTVAVRTGGGFDTSYLHLGSVAVGRGDEVGGGDALGTVGTTGRRSIAEPHLHFGVRDAGSRFAYRDPLAFLPPLPPASEPRAPRAVPVVAPQPPRLAPLPLSAPESPGLVPLPLAVPAPRRAAPPALTTPHELPAAAPARLFAPTAATALAEAAQRPHAGPPARSPAGLSPHRSRASDAADASRGRRAGTHPPRAPGRGPRAHAAPLPHRPLASRPFAVRPAAVPRGSGGIDLGWLAACLGFVAAAGLLARPRGPSAGFRRASSIAAWASTSPPRSTTSMRSRT